MCISKNLLPVFLLSAVMIASPAGARFAENYAITRTPQASPALSVGTVSAFGNDVADRLTDGRSTGNVNKTVLAAGWTLSADSAGSYSVTVDFGDTRKDIARVEVDVMTDPARGIVAPESVTAEGSWNGSEFTPWGALSAEARAVPAVVRWTLDLSGDLKSARSVRLTFKAKSDAKDARLLLAEVRVLRADVPYKLDGFYYKMGEQRWSEDRFVKEMDWLHNFGLDTLIINSGVTSTTAYYPIGKDVLPYPLKEGNPGRDNFETCFKLADERNMKFIVLCNEDSEYFFTTTPVFFKNLGERTSAVFDDMYKRYGHHRSFRGFYLGIEVWYPAPLSLMEVWTRECLKPLLSHVKSVAPNMLTVSAPFAGIEANHNAKEFRAHWDYLFAHVPEMDMFQWQDGLGAGEWEDSPTTGGRTFAYMQELWTLLKRSTDKYNKTLWCDAEFFDKVGGPYPPHFSRVRDQLASCKPFTTGVVGFEWAYLSPGNCVSGAGEFYQNYKRWHEGRPWLENIAWRCPYESNLPFEPNSESAAPIKKLTDNDRDGLDGGPRRYVRWINVSEPLTVTIDLEHVRKGIEGYGIAAHTDTKRDTPFLKVTAATSVDGKEWKDAGELRWNTREDEIMNVAQLFDQPPVDARYVRFMCAPEKVSDKSVRIELAEVGVFSTVSDIVSLNKPYLVEPAPEDDFPDETAKLTNGDTTNLWYGQCGWLGRKAPVTATVELAGADAAPAEFNGFELFALRFDKENCSVPAGVKVAWSDDGKAWSAPVELKAKDYGDQQNTIFSAKLDTPQKARLVRFSADPPSKGGWLLISETRVLDLPE